MTDTKVIARQPPEYKHSENDFSSWFAQFQNFADAMKIDNKNRFMTLKSYLDSASFAIVQNLEIADAAKEDPALFKPLLEKALIVDKIPPRLELRFRTQKSDESLSDFATALQKLCTKAAIPQTAREETLVDSFCTGVRNTELSIRLLETSFATLSLALDQAQKIEGASKIRNFVRPATSNSNVDDEVEVLVASEPEEKKPEPQFSRNRHDYRSNRRVRFNGVPTRSIEHRDTRFDQDAPIFRPDRNQHPGNCDGRHGSRPATREGNNGRYYQPGQRVNTSFAQKRCWYCNRLGHLIRDCRTKAIREAQNFQPGPSPRQ